MNGAFRLVTVILFLHFTRYLRKLQHSLLCVSNQKLAPSQSAELLSLHRDMEFYLVNTLNIHRGEVN